MITRLFLIAAALIALIKPVSAADLDPSAVGTIPIQSGGRVKPLDTFARESVFYITGKERFERRDPMAWILDWLVDAEAARNAALVDVSHRSVRELLGLPEGTMRASAAAIIGNVKFVEAARAAMQKRQQEQELDETEKQVERVLSRVNLLEGIATGESITVVPAEGSWTPIASAQGTDAYKAFQTLLGGWHDKDAAKLAQGAQDARKALAAMPGAPSAEAIERELQYNRLHPFGKAWMIYLAAFLVLLASGILKSRGALYWVAIAMVGGGLIMHAYGFFLRCTISGRAPVTNMYESVIWVSFGAVAIALALEVAYRTRSILLSALAAGVLCLILADNAPSVLDPAINPLTPVLRSNFWLTIHVLTITLSYAAFLVALAEGHVALWQYAFHRDNRTFIRSLNQQLYRAIQVGVLLLAAGTILGGVWANYSWGRFWGWDPKEVWALIALLGYLALLHGRFAGWLKDFGMAVGAVVAFLGVLMAWYGVNFVLGAGLHSYGFGDGGQGYVALVCLADLAYVGAMAWLYKRRHQA